MNVPAAQNPTCPLEQARLEVASLRSRAIWTQWMPPAISLLAVGLVWSFDRGFHRNPILVAVLGLFLLGQAILFGQLRGLVRRTRSGLSVLGVLKTAGNDFDLSDLERRLRALAADPLRDLVLGWVGLGRDFGGVGAAELLQNSIDRRSLRDHGDLSFHTLINRVVLKVGFLGTLVGLLLTFPPMKRAVLGLSDSGGELTFIRDIAKAIDEDAYAIQATLVATGFSLLLETLVVQILERFYGRFEIVESLLSDWNLTVLRRVVRRRRNPSVEEAAEDNLRLRAELAEGQKLLDEHVRRLVVSLKTTGESVDAVARAQETLHRRVIELVDWERDYRDFLAAKEAAAAPATKPSGK